MASFNRVILVGNLTRDPELRYIPSGTAVTDIGLAVNDRRKNANGEWVEETDVRRRHLVGPDGRGRQRVLSKGSPVLIEGRLKLDTWEKDGQKHSKLRVIGERMQMLGTRWRRRWRRRRWRSARPAPRQDSQYSQEAPVVRRRRAAVRAARQRYPVLNVPSDARHVSDRTDNQRTTA